jgi:hypothetical protein
MVAVMVIVATAAVSVTKDWLVTWGLRVGIGDCKARVRSRLMVHNVRHYALDPRPLTATAREVSIAERGQSGLEVPIYVSMLSTSALTAKLWPLIRRRIVLEEVVVPGVTVWLEIDGQNGVSLETLFWLVKDDPNKSSPCDVIVHQFTVN